VGAHSCNVIPIERHIVLDQQNRNPGFHQGTKKTFHFLDLPLPHSRNGFAEKQKTRVESHGPGDLQPPALTIREAARRDLDSPRFLIWRKMNKIRLVFAPSFISINLTLYISCNKVTTL
jgi:hypothetical protein